MKLSVAFAVFRLSYIPSSWLPRLRTASDLNPCSSSKSEREISLRFLPDTVLLPNPTESSLCFLYFWLFDFSWSWELLPTRVTPKINGTFLECYKSGCATDLKMMKIAFSQISSWLYLDFKDFLLKTSGHLEEFTNYRFWCGNISN